MQHVVIFQCVYTIRTCRLRYVTVNRPTYHIIFKQLSQSNYTYMLTVSNRLPPVKTSG